MYAPCYGPLNLTEHIFRRCHWLLTAFPLDPPLTICRCNILETGVFVCCSAPSPVSWFRQRKCSLCDSHSSFWLMLSVVDAGGLWKKKGCPVAVDHKLRSSHCTQTTVSSHHSRRPRGLDCACEWGAYFVFLSPDSHPWGTFHPEMCSLLFSAPLYVSAGTIKTH